MVTKESFQRELNYVVVKALLKEIRKKDLITEKEFAETDEKLKEKFKPTISSLVA